MFFSTTKSRKTEQESPGLISVSYDYKVLNAIKINENFLFIYLGTIVQNWRN